MAEKRGTIKVFAGVNEHDADNRGRPQRRGRRLLGPRAARAGDRPRTSQRRPYLYVLYTYDAAIGGTAPRGTTAARRRPGPTTDGCVVSGRISKLTVSGNTVTSRAGARQRLVPAVPQPLHRHAHVRRATASSTPARGDGASFNNVDYGQYGTPRRDQANPCGDPPGAVGTALTPPTAEGGALRSQSVRRTDGPATLDGSIIRIDPDTGQGLADNPFGCVRRPEQAPRRRLRPAQPVPLHPAARARTSSGSGDVGWNTWEEIDRVARPDGAVGDQLRLALLRGQRVARRLSDGAGLNLCASLYSAGSATAPLLRLQPRRLRRPRRRLPDRRLVDHRARLLSRAAPTRRPTTAPCSSPTTRATRSGSMMPGSNGLPDPTTIQTVVGWDTTAPAAAIRSPSRSAPGGDLFYVDIDGGAIHRLLYSAAQPASDGACDGHPDERQRAPDRLLRRHRLERPRGHALTYAWDLDGNGQFDDSTSAKPTFTYQTTGPTPPGSRSPTTRRRRTRPR